MEEEITKEELTGMLKQFAELIKTAGGDEKFEKFLKIHPGVVKTDKKVSYEC